MARHRLPLDERVRFLVSVVGFFDHNGLIVSAISGDRVRLVPYCVIELEGALLIAVAGDLLDARLWIHRHLLIHLLRLSFLLLFLEHFHGQLLLLVR